MKIFSSLLASLCSQQQYTFQQAWLWFVSGAIAGGSIVYFALKLRLKAQPSLDVPLVSAQGVDYNKLRDLLAAGEWKLADEETELCMLKVCRQETEAGLEKTHIDNFPCEDLRIIEQLWLKYSDGHFGFSVQQHIYQNMGSKREYDEQLWKVFAVFVGWRYRSGNRWIDYDRLTFGIKAPLGHLPAKVIHIDNCRAFCVVRLYDRLDSCCANMRTFNYHQDSDTLAT